ncbi:hypothetical protein CPB84DRAFT_1515002 [Gymnopilus junonius]|uniref:Dystroglycan-type cadherin-like domain-containing protein n=1 Tax=Gymnopilus junonius TaxID=109634 RepID=A0A9P5TRH2_GYMJU|nr:hypothetical protein CPB84DRAFT_1515002 [Gymnopilus junonius]
MTLILLSFLTFLTVVLAASSSVFVLHSLEKQLVQVARLGQPYSWTFSTETFSSTDGTLLYTTSVLPSWLSFDPTTRTFQGTPTTNDEGYPEITVTAHGLTSSASSKFTICVTRSSPPVLHLSLVDQFQPNRPSLSSVYFLRPNSAFASQNPTLRVSRTSSFSIGIESNTFAAQNGDVYYELRMANGLAIPEYLSFSSETVTLNGDIPDDLPQPLILPLHLHASDQEGYTATILPFDIAVADHELSLATNNLPTINITTDTDFLLSLLSPVDFMGVMVDDDPIQPANISSLELDVSDHSSWLRYDIPSRTLSGHPPNNITERPLLPVVLTTNFNQTVRTQVPLALVASYFIMSELPSLHISQGDNIQFDLRQWFSPLTADLGHDQTNVAASFEPISIANWLRFDSLSNLLTGNVPEDVQFPAGYATVTFTAYSHITHSTSHTVLDIYTADTGNTQSLAPASPGGLSNDAHKRLVMALVITFGSLGSMCLFAGIFAIARRWARVKDTAILGEEGRHALSEKDRRWYGLTLSPGGTRIVETKPLSPQMGMRRSPRNPSPLGLGLERMPERGRLYSGPNGETASPGVMSKKEFMARIKETVRQVSGKYSRKNRIPSDDRPVIGKPILVASSKTNDQGGGIAQNSSSNPFEEAAPPSRPGSTFLSGSPSASTAQHSIPRRRQDFVPPRNPAQVHFNDGLLVRQVSAGSVGANSFLSGKSGLSGDSYAEAPMGPPTRPRLVPFTSSRIPVPQAHVPEGNKFSGNRITSQRANVCESDSNDEAVDTVKSSGSGDDLAMGMHYVRSLGTDQLTVEGRPASGSSPALSNVRSSFASLESSQLGNESITMKALVRVGERFKFRVPIRTAVNLPKAKGYYAKLLSGQPLPPFIRADLSGIKAKGALELSGIATFRDVGERTVGVYAEKDELCVATVLIEVVGKR